MWEGITLTAKPILALTCFLMCGSKKKSLDTKSRLYDGWPINSTFLAGQEDAGQCMRARIAMGNNDSSSLVCFSNFSEDIKQTNCGVPLRIYHTTMLKWNRRHMISFAEATEDHLRSFFHEQLSLDLACLWRFTWWTVLLFWAHTHRSMICHLWRSYKRLLNHRDRIFSNITLHQSTQTFFWAIVGFSENKSFLRPGVHAVAKVSWWEKCQRIALSHGMSHGDIILSVLARHQCSLAQRPF